MLLICTLGIFIEILEYTVKGASDAENIAAGDVGIAFSGTKAGMAQKGLNVAYIGAIFKEMRGKGMAKAMNRHFFENSGAMDSFIENVLGRTDAQRVGCGLAGEKPGLYIVKSTVVGDNTSRFF